MTATDAMYRRDIEEGRLAVYTDYWTQVVHICDSRTMEVMVWMGQKWFAALMGLDTLNIVA